MKFNIDAPFWRFMSTLARFTVLNVLFVITCIPVVTIGPALAALYSTIFAYCDHEDVSPHREYLKRLKREFVRGLLSFLIYIAVAAVLIFGFVFWGQVQSNISYIGLAILIIATAFAILSFEYQYPLQARFDASFGRTWKNSLILPWAAFGHTIIIVVIEVAFLAVFFFVPFVRVLAVIFGFSWITYAKSLVFLKAFDKFSDPAKAMEQPTYVNSSASL